MKLRWRLTLQFILLLLLLLLVQGYLIHSTNQPFLVSALLSLFIVTPLAYLFAKVSARPVQSITEMTRQLAREGSGQKVDIYPGPEFGELSKAIADIGIELRNKIDEISKEKDYLQTILKGMVEGVLVVDGRGRILTVNDTLRNLFSLPPAVLDKTPLEVIRNSELEGAIRKVIETGRSISFELNLPSSGGKMFEVNVVGMLPPQGGDNRRKASTGAIAVFHEITRLKELEKIRQDFVANVSHELRTPLTMIKGYVETLLEGTMKEDVASQFIQVIRRHTDRLAKIVEDLLMLSKIESREFQLKREPLAIPELMGDVLDFVKEAAEKKHLEISCHEIPSSLLIEGDRGCLEQVFINLLDNAVKYNREGGKITISVTGEDPQEIRFAIQDDGIGIPREDLHRIFERFYRVDKGRSKELGGTGLGLSIVKHIVRAHAGRVWAESEPGKGSTFHVALPRYPKVSNPHH